MCLIDAPTLSHSSFSWARFPVAATNQQLPRAPWCTSPLLNPATTKWGLSHSSWKKWGKKLYCDTENDFVIYNGTYTFVQYYLLPCRKTLSLLKVIEFMNRTNFITLFQFRVHSTDQHNVDNTFGWENVWPKVDWYSVQFIYIIFLLWISNSLFRDDLYSTVYCFGFQFLNFYCNRIVWTMKHHTEETSTMYWTGSTKICNLFPFMENCKELTLLWGLWFGPRYISYLLYSFLS